MELTKYKEFLSDTKSTKKLHVEKKAELVLNISILESDVKDLQEAREVVSAAGILAQDNTKTMFESLVTKALQAVFGEEYSFELDSRYFRNQPEMEMFVVENGVKYSPKDEKGGAIVDIIAFAARIVSWAIRDPKPHNVLLLDEPFRCLSKEVLPFLAQLMQDISDQLELQIICITHEPELSSVSCRPEMDRSFLVKKIGGVSKVERIA
jgi:DNA repair exonuclease SbcCD ATPase subunit